LFAVVVSDRVLQFQSDGSKMSVVCWSVKKLSYTTFVYGYSRV